jgi:hypothetical protein
MRQGYKPRILLGGLMSDGHAKRRDVHLWVAIFGVLATFVGIAAGLYPDQAKQIVKGITGYDPPPTPIIGTEGDQQQIPVDDLEPAAFGNALANAATVTRVRVFGSGLDPALKQALDTLIASHRVETLAWSPNSWAVVFDRNQFVGRNLPGNLLNQLTLLRGTRKQIREIAFPSFSGWALLLENNELRSQVPPQGLPEALAAARNRGEVANWIGFHHLGGWVLSAGTSSLKAEGPFAGDGDTVLPSRLRRMPSGARVSFTDAGGYLVVNGDSAWASGIPEEAIRQITDLLRRGGRVRAASFLTDGRWVAVAEEPLSAGPQAQNAALLHGR